ncbi:MAG: C-terminal target protein, partial [Pedosphaera sp.]|nr:C-terminal target protein [Pedosphaera sp.]
MKATLCLLATVLASLLSIPPAPAQTYTFSVFAGQTTGIGTNDGFGTNALFNHPRGLSVDPAGNVYVADTYNASIRQITPGGLVATQSPLLLNLSATLFGPQPAPLYGPFKFT